jgi:hypothetical protein
MNNKRKMKNKKQKRQTQIKELSTKYLASSP